MTYFHCENKKFFFLREKEKVRKNCSREREKKLNVFYTSFAIVFY